MVKQFGTTPAGERVDIISLHNSYLSCEILTLGATLRSLTVSDREGNPVDVVLGYDDLDSYVNLGGHLGVIAGRCANRIAKGTFTLDGKEYHLALNNGPNHLHGGPVGFDKRVWAVEDQGEDFVTLTLDSPDGDQSYPGNMRVKLTYRLEGSALDLHYEAVTDAPTLCNLTNHSYFNLAGQAAGPVLDQELKLFCARYTPTDETSIPTGELAPVAGTPMDFTVPHPMGDRIADDFGQLVWCGGYDHNYVVDGALEGPVKLRPVAWARAGKTGIVMETFTTLPGVQLYTANGLKEVRGKAGAVYGRHHGFCLETQLFPDAVNHPGFPSPVLRPGQVWDHATRYAFSIG